MILPTYKKPLIILHLGVDKGGTQGYNIYIRYFFHNIQEIET